MGHKFNNLEIYERIYSGHWFLTSYNALGFVFDFPKIGGGNFITQIFYVMENEMCRYIYDRDEFEKAAHFTAGKLLNDAKWRNEIYKKIDFYTKAYFDAGENLLKADLSRMNDKVLVSMLQKVFELQHWHQTYAVLANGVVIDGRNHLSIKIKEELKQNIGVDNFDETWAFLTQVTRISLRQKRHNAIAILVAKADKLTSKQIENNLKKLHKQYSWLDYNNMGPASSLSDFYKEFEEAKITNKYLYLKKELTDLLKAQKAFMKKHKFNVRAKFLISLAQGVIWQKGYRKDVQYHGFYCFESVFKEIARRKNILDWRDVSFLSPWEIKNFVLLGKPPKNELKERRKFSVFVVSKEQTGIIIGAKARKFALKLGNLENGGGVTEVRGR